MQLIEHKLPNDHNIFIFGDEHEGSRLFSRKGWNKLVKMMGEEYEGCKNNYGIDGGDAMESIMVDDKRFSEDMLDEPRPLAQMKACVKSREQIADIMLAWLTGNHEDKLWRYGNVVKDMCEQLKIPYGTYACKVIIKDKNDNLMYKIFDMHGKTNINSVADDEERRMANMNLTLKRKLRNKSADCAVMIKHHAHKLLVCEPKPKLYLYDENG